MFSCQDFDSSNFLKFRSREYYEDIDFNTFSGINPIDVNKSSNYIEIVSKTKNKVVFLIHTEMGDIEYSYSETFEIENGYFYKYSEEEDDEPCTLLKESVFIKNGIILIFINYSYQGVPEYSKIRRINPDNKLIEEIKIMDEFVEPNPNMDFNTYKLNPKVLTYEKITFEIKNDYLIVIGKIKDYKGAMLTSKYTSYYEGHPNNLRVNNYWNLYRFFKGQDVNHFHNK